MDPLSISARLSAIESMAARGAWGEIRASLAPQVDGDAMTRPELVALYGESLLRTGEPRAAHRWFAPRLSAMARAANRSATRRAVNLAGAAAFEIGEVQEAERHFSEALQLAERDGDHLLIARATNNLALVASLRGERDTALAYYALAIPVYQRVGNARGLAETYHNMAITLREGGQLERAEECEREALEYARDTSNARLEAFIGVGRAELMLSRGDPAYAAFAAQRSADDFRRLGDPAFEADSMRLVGIALERQGEWARAGDMLARAVAIADSGGNARIAAECDVALARHVAGVDPARARTLLGAAQGAFEKLGARVKVEQVGRLLAQLDAPSDDATR